MDESDAAVNANMAPSGESKFVVDPNIWLQDYVAPKQSDTTYSYFKTDSSSDEWKPFNIFYVPYSLRLMTFQNWPLQMKPTAKELAAAGFYYLGSGDSVRCFHCGQCLHRWKGVDTAIGEHKRLSPLCKFVEMIYEP